MPASFKFHQYSVQFSALPSTMSHNSLSPLHRVAQLPLSPLHCVTQLPLSPPPCHTTPSLPSTVSHNFLSPLYRVTQHPLSPPSCHTTPSLPSTMSHNTLSPLCRVTPFLFPPLAWRLCGNTCSRTSCVEWNSVSKEGCIHQSSTKEGSGFTFHMQARAHQRLQ